MKDSLEQLTERILKEKVKNIELISYFSKSSVKMPIFLGSIQRKYAEIKCLLDEKLIHHSKPVRSYEFNLDKLENYFYGKYQEKIELLKDEIWRRKRKKNELVEKTKNLDPEEAREDNEQKSRTFLEFTEKSIDKLDKMEIEKEKMNDEIGELQKKMLSDPLYKFLLFLRNEKQIIFNKRTEDDDGSTREKLLDYVHRCTRGNGSKLLAEMKKKGIYKEYSPAKCYYITDLGLNVDFQLKNAKWTQDNCEKTEEEIAQEEEYNRLKKIFGF